MAENRRASSKSRNSSWRIDIGSKLIVEAPTANRFPQQYNFRGVGWIGDLNENAFEETQPIGESLPAFFGSCSHSGPGTVHQDSLRLTNRTGPDAFALDFRIQRKG